MLYLTINFKKTFVSRPLNLLKLTGSIILRTLLPTAIITGEAIIQTSQFSSPKTKSPTLESHYKLNN